MIKTLASALSLVINGVPLQATYLHGQQPGCRLAQETAAVWRSENRIVMEREVNQWCVVGTLHGRTWISEQWRNTIDGKSSEGWRIVMPIAFDASVSAAAGTNIDLVDHSINTRILYSQSRQDVKTQHHLALKRRGVDNLSQLENLTSRNPLLINRLINGDLLITGNHPDGGSYSVEIKREIRK